MKFKVYENNSDKLEIGYYRIKVKFTAGVQMAFPFTTIPNVRSYNSTLVQARKLVLKVIGNDFKDLSN